MKRRYSPLDWDREREPDPGDSRPLYGPWPTAAQWEAINAAAPEERVSSLNKEERRDLAMWPGPGWSA